MKTDQNHTKEVPREAAYLYFCLFYRLSTPSARMVYVGLSQLRGFGDIRLTDERLADLCQLSDKSARAGVRELVASRMVQVSRGSNIRAAKTYRLVDDKLARETDILEWNRRWLASKQSEPRSADLTIEPTLSVLEEVAQSEFA